jgi:hypothetical protein
MHLTYGSVKGNACAAVRGRVEKVLNQAVNLQNGFQNHLKIERIMIYFVTNTVNCRHP